ncbi:MAG: hypothetical protein JWL83_4891, partial [Actinomycetia bacterium]|nr:hypothetical protein [Actinomycetes bacterium]
MASEQLQAIVGALRANPLPSDTSAPALRAQMESWVPDVVPDAVTVETVDANGVPAEWVRADGARAGTAVLYLHGGGYCIGSIRTHRALAARISR